ncbi:MAG: ribbon-helix-helix protein, CopG family [Actinobacteria bacterium]|nr:ribbon-helix-helix protein, CopG family [Actinomycetota bacterium]
MTDVLIRDVPDDVLAAIDAKAKQAGVSRSEYLRRTLERERTAPSPVTPEQLRDLASLVTDLADDATMDDAWS